MKGVVAERESKAERVKEELVMLEEQKEERERKR